LARKSILKDLLEIFSLLPWWANLLAAVFSYWIFHNLSQAPVAASVPGSVNVAPVLRGFAGVLQYFVPFVFGLAAVLSSLGRRKRRSLLERQKDLDSIRQLSWRDFELLIGEMYRREGYSVVNTEVIFPTCAGVKFPTFASSSPLWRVFGRWTARRTKSAL
jgi:restriction system protein